MRRKNFPGPGLSLTVLSVCLSANLFVNGNVIGNKYDEEAGRAYLKKINADIQVKTTESVLASWAYESNITDANLQHQLDVSAKLANYTKDIWKETIKYPWKTFKDPDVRRQFQKFSVLGTAILSSKKYERYNKIVSDMQSVYGKAKVCEYHNRTNCSLQLEPELTEIFVKSRDPDELRYYWEQWRDVSGKPVRDMYKEYVQLSNEAAVLNNFSDTSEFWLKDYEAKDFKEQVEALWEDVKPLYLQLHAYVRRRLREQYGDQHVSKCGPIPAHLLGNMWAQSWGNVYNFTVPYPGKASMDVTDAMVEQGYTPLRMFKLAEEFFTSLNLDPMPETFWNNSILEKPTDGRDLICHASAWDFYDGKDFRIKQCTRVNMEDLNTVHHEMGHIQYFLQYKNQPLVYKEGTNPGFHEAIGDVMALSVSTPKHLKKIGLLKNTEDDEESDINQLYNMALEKIAFLPFGYLMDQWRWSVFEGKTTEKDYNCKWWQLREKYQGLSPSVVRSEADFDPGAKYHTIANVPYIRYFVSFVIQFQFHRALCIAANEYDPANPSLKPLHQCDIYQSKEAGNLLKKMLELGSSKPWPDAMEVLTGQRKMDASALLDYFATLKTWLEKENARTGECVGWETSEQACGYQMANTDDVPSPSSNTEGNLEGDNIAYSYAEFVHQGDNIYGTPDYMEEVKPSYRALLHDPQTNQFQQRCQSVPRNGDGYSKRKRIYLPETPLRGDSSLEKLLDLSDWQSIQKILKDSSNLPNSLNIKTDDGVQQQPQPNFKSPFEVRSKYNDAERTRILGIILRDLHNMKQAKHQQMAKGYMNAQPASKYKRTLSEKDESEDEGKDEAEKEENEESENKEKGEKAELNDDDVDEKSPNAGYIEDVERLNYENLFKLDKIKEAAQPSKIKADYMLDKAKYKTNKHSEAQGPTNEIMWKAEMVKNGAEEMLKNIDFSKFDNITPPAVQTVSSQQDSPNYQTMMPSNEILQFPKTYLPTQPKFEKRLKKDTLQKVYTQALDKLLNELGSSWNVMETNGAGNANQKMLPSQSREYNFNVLPMDNVMNTIQTNEDPNVGKRKSRENDNDRLVIMVGQLSDDPANGHKAYKEFHNARSPAVFNSVVLGRGEKNEKSDDNTDSLSRSDDLRYSKNGAAYDKMRNGWTIERGDDNGVNKASLKNMFSKSVRRKQININNILQYIGLNAHLLL